MSYSFPHTIENPSGERITFQRIETTPEGERLVVESFCRAGSGPIMHTHFKQDEGLTVISGKMGYQVLGEAPRYALPGESIFFKRGEAHRFWAEGDTPLHCTGWIAPVNTIVFFLSAVYAAQRKSGSEKPERFDAAYLLTRYAAEYEMMGIPPFVKTVILPLTYRVGKLLGKYKHFETAPAPLKD